MGFIFNLISGVIKTAIKLSLYLVIFATIIVLIPNLPPYTKFTSIEVTPTQPRVGPLALNEALNNAEISYKGKLLGPEAFQIANGELYTSLATGEIVKISPGGHVTFVTKVGQPCSGLVKEDICGRPLGFQIDDKGQYLYVADAYYGIWKVDLKTDKKQLLVSPRVEIEKRQSKFFNSIALAKNGDLYWTDSSSDFQLKDGAIGLFADPSGRLFHYNAAKNESKVLLDDLWIGNGVILTPNNDFVVVSETSRYRLVKYYVAGPKKGQSEVFVDGLPGTPDNIRVLPDGSGVLVGMYTMFDDGYPIITRSMAATPLVRKFIARLHRLTEIPFEYLNSLYPHIVFEEIVYYIGHFKSVSGLTPAITGLLQVDWNGNIVAAYYNTDGSLGHISDAIVYDNKLHIGSPHNDFIGKVPTPPLLKKAFESAKKQDTPKVDTKHQTKPVQQAPKQMTEEKIKVEKPKTETKPKVAEKSKVETKPKVEEKPKVAPKPVVEEKPKAEEKKEVPKVAKPPSAQPKPAQPAKATEPPKPAQATAKPPPPKPTPAPSVKPEATKKPAQTEPKSTTPKPEVRTTPPPKPVEKAPSLKTATPEPTDTKSGAPKKAQSPVKQESPKPIENKPKPIREEIPSDTAKPTKETLKVIKKEGPTEIPVPL